MSKDKEPDAPIRRFTDLWGEQAAMVSLLANIIRLAEVAIFSDNIREDLERIKGLANEALEEMDLKKEQDKPPMGFTKE